MFVGFQIPLADVRLYLSDTKKLHVPDYLLGPDEGAAEFLRNFGRFEPRRRGAGDDWPAENVYCRAARGVRFAEGGLPILEEPPGSQGRFECAYRRYLSNGKAVSRIELGLVRRSRRPLPQTQAQQVRGLLERVLHLPVRIRTENGFHDARLIEAGAPLARQVLRSTTNWKAADREFTPEDWWVTSGRVLLLLEYAPDEVDGLPGLARPAPTDIPGLKLHHVSFTDGTRIARAWLLEIEPTADFERVRQIRLHLMRMHTEREVLRQVLRQIAKKRLALPATPQERSELLDYVEKSLGFLERTSVYGNPQSELLKTAYGYDDLFTGDDRVSLLQALGDVRRHLRERLDAAAPDVDDDDEQRYQLG
jgi:hypothetical protein